MASNSATDVASNAQAISDEQREAVFAALNQQSPLILVLPTSGGKTLTFTLPTILQDPGVSIVVAPFNALEKGYIRRLRLANIKHVIWHDGKTGYASVVVVSADQVATTGFITKGTMLRKRGFLTAWWWMNIILHLL